MKFANKAAVITGAAGVIGKCVARRFAAEGASLLLVDKDETGVRQAAAEIGGERVLPCVADVTSPADVERYAEFAAQQLGAIDFFFNNAGIEGALARITEFSAEEFANVMTVNVTGVFLGIKYVMPRMNDGGSIVITSSTAGLRGRPNFVAYAASKHAVVGIMRTAALEAIPRRIRVNTIHPAMVDSDMMKRIERQLMPDATPEASRERFEKLIPLGRYMTPDEIADTVLFLASDESRMITGSTFTVDGGSMLG